MEPTKQQILDHLQKMVREKEGERVKVENSRIPPRDKVNQLFGVGMDIASLQRCIGLINATMPEIIVSPCSDLTAKDNHFEALRHVDVEAEKRSA